MSNIIYAIDVYNKTGSVDLDIDSGCMEDSGFSTDLEVGQSCNDCDFLSLDPVSMIGAMIGIAGYRKRCEKGYWKEDV